MRKIFMPSMDELYQMQEMGANVYKYLLVKAIEVLAVDGINYPNKGMLKSAYKYLREDPYIASAIGMMYPEEIKYSEVAKIDSALCLRLLKAKQNTKCSLDNLSRFEQLVLTNPTVLEYVISELSDELKVNPRYRFEYQYNELLKMIFNREITSDNLMFLKHVVGCLLDIEPAYGLTLSSSYFENDKYDRPSSVCSAVNNYANTYGIPNYLGAEYLGKDILTHQSTEVKRLIRCIKDRNK